MDVKVHRYWWNTIHTPTMVNSCVFMATCVKICFGKSNIAAKVCVNTSDDLILEIFGKYTAWCQRFYVSIRGIV